MVQNPFEGVFAPLVSVFNEQEELQVDAIIRNVHRYNQTPLRGYMPLGSNGEFQGLNDHEALTILEAVVSQKAPDKIVVGGCGRESVPKTVQFIKQAASYGLDYAFLLPPQYFAKQIRPEGLLRFYQSVADQSPIPIVVYNAPKFAAGISLSPQFISQLAPHPNIVALKNSSDTPNQEYAQWTAGADFSLIAGNIGTFYSGLCDGAVGGVLSTASYLPEYCCLLFQLFSQHKLDWAKLLSSRLQKLSLASAGPLGVAGVKAAMTLRGFEGGHVRLPLLDLSEEKRLELSRVFHTFHIPPFPISAEEALHWCMDGEL